MMTEIDGAKFKLSLNAAGKPYVLKRWTDGANGSWKTGRPHWATVWAEWHKGVPTGLRKRAVAAMGFEWRNNTQADLGWHRLSDGAHLGPKEV